MRFVMSPEFASTRWPYRFTATDACMSSTTASADYYVVRAWMEANMASHWAYDFAAGAYMVLESDAFAFRMRWC